MIRKKKRRRHTQSKPRKLFRRALYNHKIQTNPKYMCSGDFAIYSIQIGSIRPDKMDVIRLWLTKQLKKYRARLFIRCAYDKPFTKKAKQARMGKSKGKIDRYFSTIDENDVLLEIRKPTLEELMRLKKKGRSINAVEELDRKTVNRLVRSMQFRFSLSVTLNSSNYGLCTNKDVSN